MKLSVEMNKLGWKPDGFACTNVLTSCASLEALEQGLVEDGLSHFDSMSRFEIEPVTDHYTFMVSLLARAGKLSKAKDLIEKMPIQLPAIVWRSLLSACRISGNVELGKCAAEMPISADPTDSGSYILLSNIFASKGMWADVKKVRERMDCNGVVKEAGCSWTELNNEVHVFIARDKAHCKADSIWSILDNLIQHINGAGYVPEMIS
ncbi:tetratricopeptide repeat (TPR)-like superfamily protein [Actinidia rufa]|uniref:Tetratricopeptide repeat (TPR)-like superfamily protein n=1 Tax=Actinidia rufa TaxID=165716 RepID=A0A7J0EKY7_9ERIC|nr:tetratricopeptide repeat (TPR)-like superfamily protein [Actinidia rufa]